MIRTITKSLAIALLVTSNYAARAQGGNNPFMEDVNGKPLFLKTNYVSDGSPYFFDEYCLADIILGNEKSYKNVLVKFNVVDRQVLYMDDKKQEMVAVSPVKRIRFYSFVVNGVAYNETILDGIGTAINTEGGSVYQVLEDGNAKLLKRISISYQDAKKYGEANITRTFTRREELAAITNTMKTPVKMEKNKDFVISLLANKNTEVSQFIAQKKLKCRSEDDIVQVFQYYNTL